jgi:hypothetical protein
MLTWFSPCIWGSADGYTSIRSFLHSTAIGRAITNGFWWILGNDVHSLNKYDSHPELAKLKPWSEAMFVGTSFSILNYDMNFFELVKSGVVKVHIKDITHLSKRKVHLSDGTELESDALCCATGWKHIPPVNFLPEGIEKELGLPHIPSSSVDDEPIFESSLVERADKEILSRFPRLRDQKVQNKNYIPLLEQEGISTKDPINPSTPLTPWTLYRFMVPPSARMIETRDIAFAGIVMNIGTAVTAQAQSIWMCAYFDNKLPANVIPSNLTSHRSLHPDIKESSISKDEEMTTEKLIYETVLYARFGKWRYPAGYGEKFPDLVFDSLPYMDLLLGDLGLKVHRKGGWLAEVTEPYGPEDYRALIEEWMEKKSRMS